MIQHIVLLKWKPGTTDEQVDEALRRTRELVETIDSVQRITFGRNRAEDEHGFTHAIIVRLANEDALRSYLAAPARERYRREVLGPIESERIQLDLPEDAHIDRALTSLSWDWAGTRPSASAAAAALRWEETHPDD
ncbi:MAG: Dabb family protein [Solirubrobacteraceae bacterium]